MIVAPLYEQTSLYLYVVKIRVVYISFWGEEFWLVLH